MKAKFKMSTVKKVIGAIKNYRFLLALSILLATITVGLTLYIPIIIGDAIDLIIDKNNVDFDRIWLLLVNVIIISVSIALLQWIMNSPNTQMLIGNHETMLLACDFLFGEINKNFINELTLDKLELFQKWKDKTFCSIHLQDLYQELRNF